MSAFKLLAIFGAKYLIFVLLFVAGVWFVLRIRDQKWKPVAAFGAISIAITGILAIIAGRLYYDPRPFVVGHFTPLIRHAANNGFPSDHTQLSAAVACVVWKFNRLLGVGLFVLTILIGSARVYVGVHHTIDILGAELIAIISALIANLIIGQITRQRKAAI
jgi:undecaprenyl-diphosphatase